MQQQQNQYDFIMGSPNGPKPKFSIKSGSSNKMFIYAIIGLAVLLVPFIIYMVLFAGAPDNKEQLVKVVQQQTELIRVAEVGLKQSRDDNAKNLARTTSLSITSDLSSLKSTLNSQKVKTPSKLLNGGKNAKTDQLFTNAQQNNRFDEVFLKELQDELVAYQKSVKSTYDLTTNTKLKATLSTQYKNASLLIGVAPE
ncbi:MAG TPA: hypothetical protein VK694_01840 [Verrucomicrobiae bacterium]|nr:hypothetical protein [Verrucomicrobiae bacterium]